MKRVFVATVLSMAVLTDIYAGGKAVAPATEPVIAVPYINPFYIGAGILWAGMVRDCACAGGKIEEETYGGIVRIGYDFNKYIGVEARVLYSSIQKDIATTKHYGIYLKPTMPIGRKMNVYGLLGYGKTELDCVVTAKSYEEDGFSFGAGLEYAFSGDDVDGDEGWGLWVDYQNLLLDSGVNNINSNIVTMGVTYDF